MLRDAEAERAMSSISDGTVKMVEGTDPTICGPDWRSGFPDRLRGNAFSFTA
jgi:hypothetical protein